jgi:hypothetical protein
MGVWEAIFGYLIYKFQNISITTLWLNYLIKYMICREIWLTQNTYFILLYIFLNSFHSDKYVVSRAGDVARKVR